MKRVNVFIAFLLCAAVFTISSCTKKQTALNNLLGTWTYKSVVLSGQTQSIPASMVGIETLTFQACAATNTLCSGTVKTSQNTANFQYSMNSQGTVVSVINSDNSDDTYNINTLDAHNLVYTQNSTGHKFTLEK